MHLKTGVKYFFASLQNLWISFVSFLPELLGALLILIIGLVLAGSLGKLAKKTA